MGVTAQAQLLNISTRGHVGTGDDVLIAGFVAKGNRTIVARALGPSLPVQGALQDPVIELRDVNGALKASNDNYAPNSPVPPTDKREAVISATLNGGAWTAIMRGKSNSTGVGIIEIYDITPLPTPTPSPKPVQKRSVTVTFENSGPGDHLVLWYGSLGFETSKTLPITARQYVTPPLPLGIRHFFIIDRVMPNGEEFFVKSYPCTVTATGCQQ